MFISPIRLTAVETVYTMTIIKSQGSQFAAEVDRRIARASGPRQLLWR